MSVNKRKIPRILAYCSFFLLALVAGCFRNHNDNAKRVVVHMDVSPEEKAWMGKFFNDFFLEGSTIYTLFGTKPMSGISIVSATPKEWMDAHKSLIEALDEKRKEAAIQEVQNHSQSYDLNVNWEKWIAWKKNHPDSPFLFVKRATDSPHIFNAYVANTREVMWTLQEYYSFFSRELGVEFDPLEVTLDFEDPESPFWDQIFSNHFLQGILFGFGDRNSYFFYRHFKQSHTDNNSCLFVSQPVSDEAEGGDIKNIQLPRFRSYVLPYGEDPVVTKYKKEKKRIQQELQGQDFFEAVLERLFDCNP